MAKQTYLLSKTFKCGAASNEPVLAPGQAFALPGSVAGSGKVVPANATPGSQLGFVGVAQELPDANGNLNVAIHGVVQMIHDGVTTLAPGDWVGSGATAGCVGKINTADGTNLRQVYGMVLSPSAAYTIVAYTTIQLVDVLIAPFLHNSTA